jgi:hypothetical protein
MMALMRHSNSQLRGLWTPGYSISMRRASYSVLVIQSIQGVCRPDHTHATSTS